MPTVSVIMPAFNAADYIETAIRSVLRQTVTDLELIVVDDGSSDDTVAVATRTAGDDPRVRILTQPNAGPGPARNTGFRAASGRFFAFLDSDDEWAPTFLASQLVVLETRRDIDVVFGNAWRRGGARDGSPARPTTGGDERLSLADILADDNLHFIMVVFRRQLVDAVGGFDPALLTNEEYDLWLRSALAGFTFTRNPTPLGWYRSTPGSLSSSSTRMLEGALRVLAKNRPMMPPQSRELAILDRQVARYEEDLAAAKARESLAQGNRRAAREHLAALHARRHGWLLGLAVRLPVAAMVAFQLRERLRRLLRPVHGESNAVSARA